MTVQYQEKADIALIALDDGKANALSSPVLEALHEALSRAESAKKAVVIQGRPGRFCAGFDLKIMRSSQAAARELVGQGAELLMRLYTFPMPVVAACTGHAVAGGALLLLACDTRIGIMGDYRLGLNEVAIGMPLPILAQELARDRLDPRRLTEATLQARLFDPQEAVEAGYLDRAVTAEELVDGSMAEAGRLAALDGSAYRLTKQRLREVTVERIRSTLEADLASITLPSPKPA